MKEKERTLLLLKPDAVQRSLIGEILKRIEQTGLKFVGFKFIVPTKEQLISLYNKDDEWFRIKGENIVANLEKGGHKVEKESIEYGKDIIETIVSFMTSGPILAVAVEGSEAVAVVKKIVGSTEPSTSDVGTIRGDYTVDSYEHSTVQNRAVRNLVHCSESTEEANREIVIWFTEDELMKYKIIQEHILYNEDISCLD